jgi:hypothetical protein
VLTERSCAVTSHWCLGWAVNFERKVTGILKKVIILCVPTALFSNNLLHFLYPWGSCKNLRFITHIAEETVWIYEEN